LAENDGRRIKNVLIMETDKTEIKQKYWLFEKGKSGNPKGRPKGSKSIKDAVRQYLQRHPTDFTEFVKYFIEENRELAWQMLEGKPDQQTDITSKGKEIQIPIYNGLSAKQNGNKSLQTNQSDRKDIQPEKKD